MMLHQLVLFRWIWTRYMGETLSDPGSEGECDGFVMETVVAPTNPTSLRYRDWIGCQS